MKMQKAFQDSMAEEGYYGKWDESLAKKAEEILGPFDRAQLPGYGVRFTKLQAEPDGYHEYVTLYF